MIELDTTVRDWVVGATVAIAVCLALAVTLPFELAVAGILTVPKGKGIVQVRVGGIDPSIDRVMIGLCDGTTGDTIALSACQTFLGRAEATFRDVLYTTRPSLPPLPLTAVVVKPDGNSYSEIAASPFYVDSLLNVISFDNVGSGSGKALPARWC